MVKEVMGNETATQILEDSLAEGIKYFLADLRAKNVAVKIVSTSWYPITEAQWREYLFYVSETTGLGFRREEILTLNDPGPGLSADKGQKIREDMGIEKGFVKTTMFADDSKSNIKAALEVCNSLYIIRRQGLEKKDLRYIKKATKTFH